MGKFIAMNTYIKKKEISQIYNLTLQVKKTGKEKQTKPKANRKKKIH